MIPQFSLPTPRTFASARHLPGRPLPHSTAETVRSIADRSNRGRKPPRNRPMARQWSSKTSDGRQSRGSRWPDGRQRLTTEKASFFFWNQRLGEYPTKINRNRGRQRLPRFRKSLPSQRSMIGVQRPRARGKGKSTRKPWIQISTPGALQFRKAERANPALSPQLPPRNTRGAEGEAASAAGLDRGSTEMSASL